MKPVPQSFTSIGQKVKPAVQTNESTAFRFCLGIANIFSIVEAREVSSMVITIVCNVAHAGIGGLPTDWAYWRCNSDGREKQGWWAGERNHSYLRN